MQAKPASNGVPGISTAALQAIQDPNARAVLQAVVTGLNVRNGVAGGGDARFVTMAELTRLGEKIVETGRRFDQISNEKTTHVLTANEINRVITDLEASFIESRLFKELGERITLIDAPDGLIAELDGRLSDGVTNLTVITNNTIDQVNGIKTTVYDDATGLAASHALIGQINTVAATSQSAAARALYGMSVAVYDPNTGLAKAHANITEEKNTRAGSDNALAAALNTIWATVGNNTALVQTGTQVTANLAGAMASNWNQVQVAIRDPITQAVLSSSAIKQSADVALSKAGVIESKYTVKVDTNGYVAGFGLIQEGNIASGVTSTFIVRADRFGIGTSAGPAIPARLPFMVLTSPDTKGNPAGVYMDNAMIANAAIGTAKIDSLAVTGAKIADLAVDTIKISGNAITQPVFVSVEPFQQVSTNNGDNWTRVASLTLDMGTSIQPGGAALLIGVSYLPDNPYGGGSWLSEYRVQLDGHVDVFRGKGGTANNTAGAPVTSFGLARVAYRYVTVSLWVHSLGDITGNYSGVSNVRLFALGAKR